MIDREENSLAVYERDASASKPRAWLTLKQASEFLGIHFTTLRTWADNGDVPVFRTPGGHRRFSLDDLRRFLDQRASQTAVAPDAGELVDAALVHVRTEIQRLPMHETRWFVEMNEEERSLQRARGRQLFSLAVAYIVKPGQRERILADGRLLGFEYGQEAACSAVSLAEVGRAVQFFRNHLVEALNDHQSPDGLDADDVRIQQQVNQFVDEVLFAVLDGYEQAVCDEISSDVGDSKRK